MTAKQKANRERFKKVVAEAKKLRKKNPKLSQAQAVKQAWAIMYSKKRAGVGAVKKKADKKKSEPKKSSSYHKDTKSHNVNIRVISGIGNDKMIRKLSSKFLKLTGHNQLAKDVLKEYIPISNVIKAVDYAVKEKFVQVENGNFSKELKNKVAKTKAMWETYKKAYIK